MNNDKENRLVPELRFPEFRNTEAWEEKIIGDITISESSAMALNKLDLKPRGYPVYGADSIVGYIKSYQQEEKYISIVKDGSGVGRLNLCESHSSILGTLNCIKSRNKKKYDIVWLYYLLNTIDFSIFVKGSGIPHIYYSDFKLAKIGVPYQKEQQKMADCLFSLDEVITAQSKKIDALKEHKKGLMQNIFPTEGETIPKIRFPDFTGKWIETKLKKHIDLLSGYAFQSIYFTDNGQKLITPKNFTKDSNANFKIENTKYTTENFDKKYLCGEGDLLILLTDLTPSCELLGKPILLKKEDGKVLLNQRIVKVLPNNLIRKDFLLQFFLTDIYHSRIKNTASGSTVRHSSNKIILETELLYPSNEKEQQTIAECLSSLDKKIEAETNRLNELKEHKKGLMQKLFPNVNK